MLYSILIYGSEAAVAAWTEQEEAEVMGRHAELRKELLARQRLGPVMRLAPPASRATETAPVTDGPFAETKEQLLGIYVIDCDSQAEAHSAARRLAFDSAVFVVRPIVAFAPGVLPVQGMEPD
ncbi:YciI family protein [Hydrogenophaga sp.]|uniref:YciI family protein n=1 Tax=Hydrogenophaga sp. TaxID=1904254 RepID=UPI003F6F5076